MLCPYAVFPPVILPPCYCRGEQKKGHPVAAWAPHLRSMM